MLPKRKISTLAHPCNGTKYIPVLGWPGYFAGTDGSIWSNKRWRKSRPGETRKLVPCTDNYGRKKLYARRDIESLGNLYIDHLDAMTGEGLHSKSDIAAELAHRDILLDAAHRALRSLVEWGGDWNDSAIVQHARNALALAEGK